MHPSWLGPAELCALGVPSQLARNALLTGQESMLVCRLPFWVGQDVHCVDVAQYVSSVPAHKSRPGHSGTHCLRLLHPLQLPSRRAWMIGMDWMAGLQTTEGFDMRQNAMAAT